LFYREGEKWTVTMMDEHRKRVFKNRVMKIFGPKRDEVTADCIMRNFMICTPHYTLVG
jgi:hypothetical protein